MSDIITTTDTTPPRPWHGADSPFEALHDWMIKELEAVKTAANPTIKALEARIVELESRPVPVEFPKFQGMAPGPGFPGPLPAKPAVDPAPQPSALDPLTEPAPSTEPAV